jgi:VanZ family protein
LLFAVVVAAYLVVAYNPFTFDPPRYVRNGFQVAEDGTFLFNGSSMVQTEGPPSWLPRAIAGHRVTVALDVLATDADQDGPARIFTVSAETSRLDITVAQAGDNLVVALRRPGFRNGVPPMAVPSVFASPVWRSVVVRVGPRKAVIEVDGRLAATQDLGWAPLSGWNEDFPLALGGEPDGSDYGWSGRMRRALVAVPGSSVDYVADRSALVVPRDHWYFPRVPGSPLELQLNSSDVLLNVLGFVPFGLLFVLLRPGSKPLLRSAAATALLSLTMEFGQLFVESRNPSVVDFALNVLGGTMGGALALSRTRREPRSHAL